MQTMLCLRLLRPDDPEFFDELVAKVAHNPEFFRGAPMVLDVGALAATAPDGLGLLVERLRQQRLAPVGIQNGSESWNQEADRIGLAIFAAGAEPKPRQVRKPSAPAPRTERVATMVIKQPVRGGQQIVSEADLVILAPVSAGAEIAAAGNIHVYGALRGRAFAGMQGDQAAMIFCDQLDAELVSIAGIHAVAEDIDQRVLRKRVQVSLDGDALRIQPSP